MWDLIVSVPDHCLSFYFFTSFSKIVFSDKCLQILKIVRGQTCVFFWTWTTRLYPTEEVQSIFQPQIFTHFSYFRLNAKV